MVKNTKKGKSSSSSKKKHDKTKLDPRRASSSFSNRRSRTSRSCAFCKERGTLLPCTICAQAYHLSCLGVSESEVSFLHWVCIECTENYDKRLLDEDNRLVKTQKVDKESKAKKLYQKLMRSETDTRMKRFKRKHPELVKSGRIVYPIDDSLL